MTLQEATQDTAGNVLRKTSSGWEILQKGVGWREFIGYTVLTDGRIIDTRLAPTMPQDVIDQSQHQKQLEDDLFRHYAGIIIANANVHDMVIDVSTNGCLDSERYIPNESAIIAAVGASCSAAQAMIDELKKRGRL